LAQRDYYEILGVNRTADDAALKAAYREVAKKYHPDRNPGNAEAEEKFKAAAEAYSILSDPQKRASYDRFGHAGVGGGGGAPPGFDPNQFSDFSDILGDLFFGDIFGRSGGGGRGNRPRAGDDLRYDLEIAFEDSIRGMQADVQVPRMEACERCEGSGAEKEDGLVSCPACRGRGEVNYQQGFLTIRRTCGQCGGRGKIIRRPCKQCKGEGYSRTTRKLKVTIPAGVSDGIQLRVPGEGQPSPNQGPPGDLYVVIRVKEHPIFERHEYDLHCTVPVNVAQATLGTEIDLLTFDGLETIQIPEATQPGTQIKVKGKGVPRLHGGGRGDLFVHVEVRIPTKLSKEQRKLIEQLSATLPSENEPEEKGLFDKVKDYFM
jgi:molecular chaperone DnaJ